MVRGGGGGGGAMTGADCVGLQTSGWRKGGLWRVVGEDIKVSRKGEENRDQDRRGKDGDLGLGEG